MSVITNFFGHIKTVLKHKWQVFKLCLRAGIPWQGVIHDLSKFSITELKESIKYYNGKRSPLAVAKEKNGYSLAWLHHIGLNKHHYQYWHDYEAPNPTPKIPYKYVVEMVCDSLAAGITYRGKEWTKEYQLSYWNRVKERAKISDELRNFLDEVYSLVANEGIKPVINKKRLNDLYYKHFNSNGNIRK